MSYHSNCSVGKRVCEKKLLDLIPTYSINKHSLCKMLPVAIDKKGGTANITSGSHSELLPLHLHGSCGVEGHKITPSDYDVLLPFPIAPLEEHKFTQHHSCWIRNSVWKEINGGFDSLFLVQSPSLRPGFYHVGCLSKDHLSHGSSDPNVCVCTHAAIGYNFDLKCGLKFITTDAYWTDCFKGNVSYICDGGNTDQVTCIPCVWPNSLKSVLHRHASSNWPDEKTLGLLKEYGKTFLVYKAHPYSKDPEIEFRVSFSIHECILARSLPNGVRQMFLIARIFCMYMGIAFGFNIKTYHLKTALFWMLHKHTCFSCTSEPLSLRKSVIFFLQLVGSCFRKRVIKHFFVPQLNLLDGFYGQQCDAIAVKLEACTDDRFCKVVRSLSDLVNPHPECLPIHPWLRRRMLLGEANVALSRWNTCRNTCHIEERQREMKASCLFQEALSQWPHDAQLLIDSGRFYELRGDKPVATVLWLNALVILGYSVTNPAQHFLFEGLYQDYDPAVRLIVRDHGASFKPMVYCCTMATHLLVYHRCLAQCSQVLLVHKSKDFLCELMYAHVCASESPIERDICTTSLFLQGYMCRRQMLLQEAMQCFSCANCYGQGHGFVYLIRAALIETSIFNNSPLPTQKASADETILSFFQAIQCQRANRAHIYELCAAASEYVRDFRPDYTSGRRHSVHTLDPHWFTRDEDTRSLDTFLRNLFLDD